MIRRVTITFEQYQESRIRDIRARKITESKKSISFSNVVNQVLMEGLKKFLSKMNGIVN